ncbi:two-pore potassium channel 1-like [Chenopodium quinoa]|uniref:two-pore potassium channel 1-like n=1 Tax=Chenopodium quinoa TaxID=63459 RepID=UPI000B77B130|nr:two-pore potassium channel 1-like [Chenopodium quinoa]
MALVGLVLTRGANYLAEKQELLLVRALQMRKKLIRPGDIMKDIMETSKVQQNCIMAVVALLLLMICGTVFLMLVEKLEAVNAFYCVCVTIMSLGYGDYGFSTEAGRIFAIFTERRQNAVVRWVITRRATIVDLEAAATNIDGGVEVAEFVLYKLKDMGKITQNDISVVMKEFKDLDFDQS